MSFEYLTKIPTSGEILEKYPLTEELKTLKAERDQMVSAVIKGESDKLIMIIGPCSADHEDAVCEYVERLGELQKEVSDKLVLIPRIYTNKPRTTGEGYKGILHQPDPEKAPDMVGGLVALRKMHLKAFTVSGLTPADEMLYPENLTYLDDILSYIAVGARSVENQQHRLAVSGVDVAVGLKNPTSGDFSVMLNSVQAAQLGHVFSFQSWAVQTTGNPLAHTVLRGSVNKYGQSIPNYHYEDLKLLWQLYQTRDLSNPACIIDTNHANSGKVFSEQPRIALEVMHSRRISPEIRSLVKGFMIESYLVDGCQKVGGGVYGQSITDPCLGWEGSKELLLKIADQV